MKTPKRIYLIHSPAWWKRRLAQKWAAMFPKPGYATAVAYDFHTAKAAIQAHIGY